MPRPGRSMLSSRAKAILNMVGAVENDSTSIPTSKEETETEEEKINKLYARPYSMTTQVFDKFCDTQTTLISHHLQDLAMHINKLKKTFLLHNTACEPPSRSISPTLELKDLTCYEKMPSIPEDQQLCEFNNLMPESPLSNLNMHIASDFDSDDSVFDKDYIPNSSDESDNDFLPASTWQKALFKSNIQSSTSARHTPPISIRTSNNDVSVTIARQNNLEPLEHLTEKATTKKRRNTIDFREVKCIGLENGTHKRRNTIDTIQESGNINLNCSCVPSKKRKVYMSSLAERTNEKKQNKKLEYSVKPGCNAKCLKKCSTYIGEEQRNNINQTYWSLTWEQRRLYIRQRIATAVPKRKYTKEPIRNPKRSFTLKTSDGNVFEVCKVFFLTTLGFKKNNDKVIRFVDNVSDVDQRGKHTKTPAYDRQLLEQHVASFHPYEPHYRRDHAPLRRYLPSDLNIRQMHKDYCEKNPSAVVSYELYRKHLKSMNISFTRLGNEECEICETYHLHNKETSHDFFAQVQGDCCICVQYSLHHGKYTNARQLYAFHKSLPQNQNQIYFTADLEKVIMLPRMESFKSVIFCPRLIAFNQTFAPVGKITNSNKPVTVLWHDAIAGRKQDDIMSAFYTFLIRNRDVENVNIWLDNCSAQNKNWLLFSLLVHLVNSDLISTKNITLYFFEPGHTFMSADQVHHQVELAMKKKGRLYDFQDFVDAVSSINNSKVIAQPLSAENFIHIPNLVSDRRIQKSNPRAYLKNMVQVTFKRDDFDLYYKNNFEDEFTALRFMNDKYLKSPRIMTITFRSSPKGIDAGRKSSIINKLAAIIPPHKLTFWNNLPTNDGENTNDETEANESRGRNTI